MASSKDQEVEVLDNWEDIDDSEVLERQFSNMKTPTENIGTTMNAPFSIILTGDDALRSQYVPPEPTITILKRPDIKNEGNDANQVTHPKKTLKQREQEYAEARLRILGEASSCEKPDDTRLTCIQSKVACPTEVKVIRMPRGPDGTKGFTKR